MPLDLTTHMHELMLKLRLHHGDIVVLGLRSWWRRLLKREVWAIATKVDADLLVESPSREVVRRFGHMKQIDDPALWPDDVCAAVAAWKLTH